MRFIQTHSTGSDCTAPVSMKFKRDYKITVSADTNDEVFWSATHKGEPTAAKKSIEDYAIISDMLNNARLRINRAIQRDEKEDKGLEYWLRYYGMPEENIEKCVTQIAEGYGACRYLDGVKDGAEAVNVLAEN